MRLSRHAKNEARRLGATLAELEDLIANPVRFDRDESGKPRYTGYLRDVRVRVVVA